MPEGIVKELVRVLPGWCVTLQGGEGQRMGEGPWKDEAI